MKWWMFFGLFFLTASSGFMVQAEDERCVLRFNREEVDVVRGELRVDLNRRVQRECRGLSAGDIRLDQVTVELRDSRRRDSRYDDRRDDRYRGRSRGGDTVQIFRFYNGRKHRVSDDPDEGARTGFGKNEGPVFELYNNGGRNRKPIYACLAGDSDHFLSLQSDCEGHRNEGQLGFIGSEGSGGRPLYRCFNGKLGDHIATVDQNECAAAKYAVESTLGYVP
jgi:hypothetical protein